MDIRHIPQLNTYHIQHYTIVWQPPHTIHTYIRQSADAYIRESADAYIRQSADAYIRWRASKGGCGPLPNWIKIFKSGCQNIILDRSGVKIAIFCFTLHFQDGRIFQKISKKVVKSDLSYRKFLFNFYWVNQSLERRRKTWSSGVRRSRKLLLHPKSFAVGLSRPLTVLRIWKSPPPAGGKNHPCTPLFLEERERNFSPIAREKTDFFCVLSLEQWFT